MNSSDNDPPDVEIKDGKIVHDGHTWSPHVLGMTFVVRSLSVGQSVNEYSATKDFTTALNGDATVECRGLLVIGKHTKGVRAVQIGIQAADPEWLAQTFEGVADPRDNKLPSRAKLGHTDGDAELNIAASFYVSVYLPQHLFDTLLAKVREKRLDSLWISARFQGVYADFPWGQTEDTRLGLAPGRHLSEAHGRVDHINFREQPLDLTAPPWSSDWRDAAFQAELDAEDGKNTPTSTLSAISKGRDTGAVAPSLARVEGLLSQLAVATRWVGWGLLALTVAVALHLR